MKMRRLLNVTKERQRELQSIYSWLRTVHENEEKDTSVLFVSVFDHWLTRDEACALLENVPPKEQLRRDTALADFCSRIVCETEVLSFALRGRKRDRLIFRRFTSSAPLSAYVTPNGGKTFGHRHFYVALPELRCALYESWDDTYQIYFAEPAGMDVIARLAKAAGLYTLSRVRAKAQQALS